MGLCPGWPTVSVTIGEGGGGWFVPFPRRKFGSPRFRIGRGGLIAGEDSSLRRSLKRWLMSKDPASASSSSAAASQHVSYSAAPYFPVPFHLQKADHPATSQPQGLSQQYPKPYIAPPQGALPPVKVPAVAPVYAAAYPAATSAAPGVYTLPQYQQVRFRAFYFSILLLVLQLQWCYLNEEVKVNTRSFQGEIENLCLQL